MSLKNSKQEEHDVDLRVTTQSIYWRDNKKKALPISSMEVKTSEFTNGRVEYLVWHTTLNRYKYITVIIRWSDIKMSDIDIVLIKSFRTKNQI